LVRLHRRDLKRLVRAWKARRDRFPRLRVSARHDNEDSKPREGEQPAPVTVEWHGDILTALSTRP